MRCATYFLKKKIFSTFYYSYKRVKHVFTHCCFTRPVVSDAVTINGGKVAVGRLRRLLVVVPSPQFVQRLSEGAAERRTGEIVHDGVEDAVEVGEAHGRVERQVGLFEMSAFVIPHLQDPHGDARHGAGEKAGDEDEGHGRDELNGALDLPPFVQSPVSQLPGDSDGAERHDGGRQEKLDDVEGVVPGGERRDAHADVETLALCAVAVVEKVLAGEKIPGRQKNQPPQAD